MHQQLYVHALHMIADLKCGMHSCIVAVHGHSCGLTYVPVRLLAVARCTMGGVGKRKVGSGNAQTKKTKVLRRYTACKLLCAHWSR